MADRTYDTSIRWSNLARYANGPVSRALIIMPFLGFLIFFNSQIEELFKPLRSVESGGLIGFLSNFRVEILYLGLMCVGLSSGLFALFSPQQIKDHKRFSEYFAVKNENVTQSSVEFSLHMSLGSVCGRDISSELSVTSVPIRKLPLHYQTSFKKLLERVFDKGIEREADRDELIEAFKLRLDASSLNASDVYTIEKNALNFSKDVFRFEYIFVEYEKFLARSIISALFSVGIFLSLLPNITTILLIIKNLSES